MNTDCIYVVGVDEVGRGPLAGPVTVGAVAVPISQYADYVRMLPLVDSKTMSESKRNRIHYDLCNFCTAQKISWHVASSKASTIDSHGIMEALHRATHRALKGLDIEPTSAFIMLDRGLRPPRQYPYWHDYTKGDSKHWVIQAAALFAKVHRDTWMINVSKTYPEYGFERHKGYGTKAHRDAIHQYGICKLHRRSWIKVD